MMFFKSAAIFLSMLKIGTADWGLKYYENGDFEKCYGHAPNLSSCTDSSGVTFNGTCGLQALKTPWHVVLL